MRWTATIFRLSLRSLPARLGLVLLLLVGFGLVRIHHFKLEHATSHDRPSAIGTPSLGHTDNPDVGHINFPERPMAMAITNFYVSPSGNDANDGSVSAPWATIQHAANVVTPGSAVHVAPGIYGAINSQISGTADARIRFISDVKWGAKLETDGATVWNNSGSYVDIMGFDVTGNVDVGIQNDGSFVRIIGNNVHNIPGSCSSNGGAGIDNDSFTATDNDIVGNVVHDIGNPAVQCATVQGIYHANLRGHIVNNISYHNAAWGIHLWHAATNVVIANNLVFQNGDGGIVVGAGDAPGGVIDDNTIVSNNIVMSNGSNWGSGLGISEQGSTGTGNQYLNNLIWNNTQGIVLQNGLHDESTIRTDPQLVNYRLGGRGDYHLRPTSPAISSGSAQGLPPIDFDGAPTATDARPHIGPYVFPSKAALWPWM